MSTAFFTHRACLDHDTGPGHPERPERLRAVWRALDAVHFPELLRAEAPLATQSQLEAVHDPAYIQAIMAKMVGEGERLALDPDTWMSAGTLEAALRAAGGAVHAVDLVLSGKANNAFVAVRPPGHHAEPGQAMGFCLFNSVAIAARYARDHWGVARVAVADFDVHHGNGTQAAFWDDPAMFFASSHQSPLYPGSGTPAERGGSGNIVNAPLPPGAGSDEFRAAWREDLLPAIAEFAPDLVLISAGFDAHHADPLAQMRLNADDYTWITEELCTLAAVSARGRVVSLLEGGYDLEALATCSAAHVAALARATMPV